MKVDVRGFRVFVSYDLLLFESLVIVDPDTHVTSQRPAAPHSTQTVRTRSNIILTKSDCDHGDDDPQ
jgi:hypothetical protein